MRLINYVAAMLLFLCLTGHTHGQTGGTKYGAGSSKIGENNSSFGDNAGYFLENESKRNSFFGQGAGQNTRKGKDNTHIGHWAGSQNFNGSQNTNLGSNAASNADSWNNGNVYLGFEAGRYTSGSNKLIIGNDESKKLIYGEFDNNYVKIKGKLKVTEGLYFKSDYHTDGLSQPRLINTWGVQYKAPVSKWVFSSKNSVLVGYEPNGTDYGKGSLFVENAIGIGTTNPSTQFEMNTGTKSDSNALLRVTGEFNPGFELYSSGAEHDSHLSLKSNNGQDNWRMSALASWVDCSLGMFYNGSRQLIISKEGNVGISKTAPSHKIEIEGAIQANQFVSSAINFPDYVFEPDYCVMPLTELASFVEENKHLPNMPSEKEVMENGMNITNVAIKSVENIENIYLHLIDLSKKVDEYGKKVVALEEENATLQKLLSK